MVSTCVYVDVYVYDCQIQYDNGVREAVKPILQRSHPYCCQQWFFLAARGFFTCTKCCLAIRMVPLIELPHRVVGISSCGLNGNKVTLQASSVFIGHTSGQIAQHSMAWYGIPYLCRAIEQSNQLCMCNERIDIGNTAKKCMWNCVVLIYLSRHVYFIDLTSVRSKKETVFLKDQSIWSIFVKWRL